MNLIEKGVSRYSAKARGKRAAVFRRCFRLDERTRILDLGAAAGAAIHAVLEGTPVTPGNVYIADIDSSLIQRGARTYGYVPVLIGESERLPFADGFFDIVYCSSVIEHVTVPKERVWSLYSDREFEARAFERQRAFAREIRRLGRQYFVQTPYRHFPVESHTWLPGAAWLPRRLLVPLLKFTNAIWIKKTQPDWHLLTRSQLAAMFAEAEIISEKWCGLTKSLMAVYTRRRPEGCPGPR